MEPHRASSRQQHFFEKMTGEHLPDGISSDEASRLISSAKAAPDRVKTIEVVPYEDGGRTRWLVLADHREVLRDQPSEEACREWAFQTYPNASFQEHKLTPGQWFDDCN